MVVGLTGHQRIGSPAAGAWVREQLFIAVKNHEVSTGVMCLAKGADQLFAAVLLELEIPYVVVLPCRRYEETFSGADLPKFHHFLRRASRTQEQPFDEPSERAFYEAGKAVVEQSDLVIAIWDGKPARGLGGTADIVKYVEQQHKPLVHINPLTRAVQLR